MANLNKNYYYIDFFGLGSIGAISLGYVVFIRRLAEQHIQFPFLNFPIFVGEIVLFFCLVLFLVKCKFAHSFKKMTESHYLILLYFAFVIIKALYGYVKYGPLAFRHAALLYYPVFAIFSYSFFRKDFFNEKMSSILFLFICVVLFGSNCQYWALSLTLLALILTKSSPNRFARYLMLLILFFVVPYRQFFSNSRMMIVSNFFAGLFLTITLSSILKVGKKFKIGFVTLMMIVTILGSFKFTDQGMLKSIIAFNRMAEELTSRDAFIKANEGHFKMRAIKKVKLYNPDYPQSPHLEKDAIDEKKLKANIIAHVKNEITGFSYQLHDAEGKLATIYEKVKKELKSMLNAQLQTPELTESSIVKQASLSNDQIQNKQAAKVEKQVAPISAVVHETEQKPAQKLVRTDSSLNNNAQENDSEKVKKVRGILVGQVEQEILLAPTEDLKKPDSVAVENMKREIVKAFHEEVKENKMIESARKKSDTGWVYNSNAVFRLLIWRDMLRDLVKEKPILGFDFGKPFRSKSLEILNWGNGDWARDGWIEPHNSYLHIIYRASIVGVLLIFSLLFVLIKMVRKFIAAKSFTGILLCGIIITWFVAANFLVIFELPYTAIPIWAIYGMTFAYCYKVQEENDFRILPQNAEGIVNEQVNNLKVAL